MRVFFVHPPWPGAGYGMRSQNRWPRKRGDKANRYPLYLCYVATALRDAGATVRYADAVMEGLDKDTLLDRIAAFAPDLLYLETSTPTANYDLAFLAEVKSRGPSCTTVLAGSHATYFAERIVGAYPQVDVVVMGEPDGTARAVYDARVRGEALAGIPGTCARAADGTVTRAAPRPLLADLEVRRPLFAI